MRPPRRRFSPSGLLALLAAGLLVSGMGAGQRLAAASFPAVPDSGRQPAMQITLLPTLIFPTATRTPTPINLGNFVWDDLDHDGRQDAGEPGLAGVTVQLWNSAKTQLLASTTTNTNGNYTVVAPIPGDYRIRVLLTAGASFTVKDQAGVSDTQDSDFNPTGTNFGFTDIISIASNVISITSLDAGLLNVVPVTATFTPTPTRTPTATPTRTPTATPPVGDNTTDHQLYLPAVTR
jgi:hypothetical protein